MKFLVDMPLSPNVAKWLSDKGHTASHASEVGLHDAPDATILAVAATDGSVRGGNYKDAEILERLGLAFDNRR